MSTLELLGHLFALVCACVWCIINREYYVALALLFFSMTLIPVMHWFNLQPIPLWAKWLGVTGLVSLLVLGVYLHKVVDRRSRSQNQSDP